MQIHCDFALIYCKLSGSNSVNISVKQVHFSICRTAEPRSITYRRCGDLAKDSCALCPTEPIVWVRGLGVLHCNALPARTKDHGRPPWELSMAITFQSTSLRTTHDKGFSKRDLDTPACPTIPLLKCQKDSRCRKKTARIGDVWRENHFLLYIFKGFIRRCLGLIVSCLGFNFA